MADLSTSTERAVLISTILASSMAFIDSTALNVALPALQQDLSIDGTELLWVINSYALFLSALLLTGGSLGDHYGRKRIFKGGIVLFIMASMLCGFAQSPIFLIVSRSIQGIGAAMMVPGSLSLISALFKADRCGWAIGTWSTYSAMTTITGPALGGWLASMGLWRAIFFLNIPLAIIALYFLNQVPESKENHSDKIDTVGALLATFALACLTYGFIEAPNYGFDHTLIQLSLFMGGLLLIGFIIHEYRSQYAMMPLWLFQSPLFSSTNLITLLVYSALGGFLFFFPLNLIQVQHYPADLAGLSLLPFGLLIAFLSRWSGIWCDKVGPRAPLITGTSITAIGFFMFSIPGLTVGPIDFWSTFFPAIVLLGIGMGITVAPLTTAVMGSVPPERTGTASGVNNTIARTAGVLAIAVMGSFGLITFQQSLQDAVSPLGLSSKTLMELENEIPKLAEASAPESASPEQKIIIEEAIDQAFILSFNQSALVACILAGSGTLLAFIFIRRK